jgi:DNA-binding MarR family transcriptional regulator
VIAIFRLGARLVQLGDAMALPAGQTTARWQVLAAADDDDRSVADIARALGLARQSVQRIADALVAEGSAEYADNPRHRRARLLRLTEDGRRSLAAIQRVQAGWADRVGEALGTDELDRLLSGLQRLSTALDDDAPTPPDPD